MEGEFKPNDNGFIIRIFFILTTFLCMVRYEGSLYSTTDSFRPGYQTQVELVVSERRPSPSQFKIVDAFARVSTGSTGPHVDLSSIYKYSMLRYHHFVSQRLKYCRSAFSNRYTILSIIQKNNTWHQSPDDDSILIG